MAKSLIYNLQYICDIYTYRLFVHLQEQCQNQSLPEDMRGSLNFSIHYDLNLELLRVFVKQACDLVPRQFSGTADPYAEVS